MHINVTIGLLGFAGHAPDMAAFASKLTMADLLLICVLLCVRSFIAERGEAVPGRQPQSADWLVTSPLPTSPAFAFFFTRESTLEDFAVLFASHTQTRRLS